MLVKTLSKNKIPIIAQNFTMRLLLLLFMLTVLPFAVIGQAGDSVVPARGFFGGWKLSGISLSVGRHNALNKDNWSPVFEKLLASNFARNKWNADKNAIAQFPIQNMEMRYNLTGGMRLGITLKPRILKLLVILK